MRSLLVLLVVSVTATAQPDPADGPVVQRTVTPSQLADAVGIPAGWFRTDWNVGAGALGPGDTFTETSVVTSRTCVALMTEAEQAAVVVPTPASVRYRTFHPVYGCGVVGEEAPLSRPTICLTLQAGSDAQVEAWLSSPPAVGVTRTDTLLGGRRALVDRDSRGWTTARLRHPGGLLTGFTGNSIGVLDRVLSEHIIGPVPPPTALVAFERNPQVAQRVLWDGTFTTALAPGRILSQSTYWPMDQLATALPADWTWANSSSDDDGIWLSEAGATDALRRGALTEAARSGIVLALGRGFRPDRLLNLRDTLIAVYGEAPKGLSPFLGWTFTAPPEPVALDGWPAAVRFTLHSAWGTESLVAQGIDAVWAGVDAVLIVVVSRPEDASRAAEVLRRAVAETTVRRL